MKHREPMDWRESIAETAAHRGSLVRWVQMAGVCTALFFVPKAWESVFGHASTPRCDAREVTDALIRFFRSSQLERLSTLAESGFQIYPGGPPEVLTKAVERAIDQAIAASQDLKGQFRYRSPRDGRTEKSTGLELVRRIIPEAESRGMWLRTLIFAANSTPTISRLAVARMKDELNCIEAFLADASVSRARGIVERITNDAWDQLRFFNIQTDRVLGDVHACDCQAEWGWPVVSEPQKAMWQGSFRYTAQYDNDGNLIVQEVSERPTR